MDSKRTSFVQLPSGKELKEILAKEAHRDISEEQENRHYADFAPIISFLEKLGLDSSFFVKEFAPSDFDDEELVSSNLEILDDMISSVIGKISGNEAKLKPYLDGLYDYLSEEDRLEKSDFIFVFGSKSTLRTEKAMELYKMGLASKLLISGRGPIYESGEQVFEAESLRDFAVNGGLPPESVLVEKNSISIPDNVKSSLNYLDSINSRLSSIIIVNSPFSQRRGFVHFKKFLPENVKIYRANSAVSDKYSKDSWFKSEEGIKVVINEYIKMKIATILNTA